MFNGIELPELFRRVVENPNAIEPFLEKFVSLDDNELFELFKRVRGKLAPQAASWT